MPGFVEDTIEAGLDEALRILADLSRDTIAMEDGWNYYRRARRQIEERRTDYQRARHYGTVEDHPAVDPVKLVRRLDSRFKQARLRWARREKPNVCVRLDGGPAPSERFQAAVLEYAAWYTSQKAIRPGAAVEPLQKLYRATLAFAAPVLEALRKNDAGCVLEESRSDAD